MYPGYATGKFKHFTLGVTIRILDKLRGDYIQ